MLLNHTFLDRWSVTEYDKLFCVMLELFKNDTKNAKSKIAKWRATPHLGQNRYRIYITNFLTADSHIIMDCTEEDRMLLKRYAPYVYERFQRFEQENNYRGLKISFRDTDHTYESFRWYVFSNIDFAESARYLAEKLLNEDIESHCCICGSTHLVSLREYNAKNSSSIFERFCASCYGNSLYGYKKIEHFAKYNQWCKKQNTKPTIPHMKIRLLNDCGEMFYDWLENLFYDKDRFYVSNIRSTSEHVRYAGMYLGIRDKNNERVYEGDIVLGHIEQDNNSRLFWGMAFEDHSSGQEKTLEAINHIWLYHGDYNVCWPSPLNCANTFEVVGNVIEGSESDILQNNLALYYKGYDPRVQ